MIIGSYFGEIEIIYKTKRYHTTVAAESSELLTLSKQIYESIIVKDFFEIHEELKFIAGVRHEKNMEAEKFLNQTLTNNKERLKKKLSFFGKGNSRYSLAKALLEIKKYKRVIDQLIHKRSQSFDDFFTSKEIMPRLNNKLLKTEEPVFNYITKDINTRTSMQSIQSLKNFQNKLTHNERNKNIFNWSSESEDQLTDSNNKTLKSNNDSNDLLAGNRKLAFYNKLIVANKENQNSRRPSFILKNIVQNKVSGNMSNLNHIDNAIKEESSDEKSYDSDSNSNSNSSINEKRNKFKLSQKNSNKRKSLDNLNSNITQKPFSMLSNRNLKRGLTTTYKKQSSINPDLLIKKNYHSSEANVSGKNKTSHGIHSLAGNVNEFVDNQKHTLKNLTQIVGELKNTLKDFTS